MIYIFEWKYDWEDGEFIHCPRGESYESFLYMSNMKANSEITEVQEDKSE